MEKGLNDQSQTFKIVPNREHWELFLRGDGVLKFKKKKKNLLERKKDEDRKEEKQYLLDFKIAKIIEIIKNLLTT